MNIYADTSIFGGVFDEEFKIPSIQFFKEIDYGKFNLVTSALVEAEIEPASEEIRLFFQKYAESANIVETNTDTVDLQLSYIEAGVVTKKSLNDALHVALATISNCEMIISWNFKHIVHYDKIIKFNAVNMLKGYGQIGIHSPLEIINYDN